MPEVLVPLAKYVLRSMGSFWLLAVFVIGIVHGLKPDEHTWPVTVSYGLMQRSVRGVVAVVSVFAGALTLVWSALSAFVGWVMGFIDVSILDPYVDLIVGVTMIGVAAYLFFGHNHGHGGVKTADYKLVWIHGLAAAFGGDFFVVLILSTVLAQVIHSWQLFLVGFMFGFGSWLAQLVVVILIYRGVVRSVKDWAVVANAGRVALGLLGIFMITLGLYGLLISG
ncbi:hypothetical protein [Vulcanisaeta thermophila]|uniref:hypothetical protein n=1 Tax=Vulcanisaeta thermophila TaxID=867917 RepID=UPI00350E3F4F